MYLCLSGRILESSQPRPGVMEFLRLARDTGYDGVGLRGWQVDSLTTDAAIREVKEALGAHGLRVSSISTTPAALATCVPKARELGVKTLRISDSPEGLRRAADTIDPDMRLGTQMHTGGDYETVALAAAMLDKVGHPRVGVIVEPSNLLFAGESLRTDLFAPLRGRIVGCNFQSCEVGVGESSLTLRDGRRVAYRRVDAAHNDAIDFPAFFAALQAAGYDGYVDVIEPALPQLTIRELASSTAACLRTVAPGAAR